MSYPSLEESVDAGRPLYFYEFIYGDAQTAAYRYVAALSLTVYGGRPWVPFPIKHGEIVITGSLDRQTLTVTAREDIEMASLVVSRPPSRLTVLNIYRGHTGDDDLRMVWTGRVLSGTFNDNSEVEFSCEPISTSLLTAGLRRKYQRGCPHALYGRACGLDKMSHTESGAITAVEDAMDITVVLTGADHNVTASNLLGGIFRVVLKNGMTEIRAITSATADPDNARTWRITVISPIYDLTVGRSVSVSKGCLHTYDACKAHNNSDNYGGCLNIPTKSPFTANQF